MRVNVLALGPAAEWVGERSITVELAAGATAADLARLLAERFPALARGLLGQPAESAASVRLAVNAEFADPAQTLIEGDEVAIIPPVSGGEDADVWLTDAPIDADAIRQMVSGDAQSGGIVVFEGTTRADVHPEHGALQELAYKAYGEMAVRQMTRLLAEARGRWPVRRAVMAHRVGLVPVGEPSVVIAVASSHRAEAFEACRWLIDTLKRDVPIWKREKWADGTETWVDPTRQP
jgi:molybdopterin synthase catalytic subunit